MTVRTDENGKKVFHCDTCPEHIETGRDDFAQAQMTAKKFGWRKYVGPDGKFADACPVCTATYAEEQRKKRERGQ